MEFVELKIENFSSIENETLHLDRRGVLLISGENGAGKSSLTSKAICWALFGQTQRGIKGDAVVNVRNPTAPAGVELSFRVAGKSHVVKRRRNPASLELDGQRYRVPAETQRAIEQLIGRNIDSFMATDYFGQDRAIDFLSMSSTAQMESMEQILHLSRLDQIVECTKAKAAKVRAMQADAQVESQTLRGQIDELDRQMAVANQRYEVLQRAMDDRELHRRAISDREDELRRKILKQPVVFALGDRRRIEDEIAEVESYVRKHIQQDALNKSRAYSLRNEVAGLRALLRDVQDRICPTCGGPVDPEVTTRLREEQLELRKSYESVITAQEGIVQWLSSSPVRLQEAQNNLVELQRQLDAHNDSIHEYEGKLRALNEDRDHLTAEDVRDQAIMQELVRTVDALTVDRRNYEEVLDNREKDSKQSMKRLSMLQFWIDTFGKTFKNLILEQALPFLQERTEYHLRLLNNPELKVSFSTQKVLKSGEERHQFTVTASREQGGQSEVALSGGERQIVSFAVGLALSELADSQTGSPSNLMILDEPFSMLSEKNSEAVVHYVTTELVKRKATILLISNDERMKALIPGGIHVRRDEDGKSRVV